MHLSRKRILHISVVLNVILIAVGIFFCAKRAWFQHHLVHKQQSYKYEDNSQYAAELNIEQAYDMPAGIVMFGSSHTYKARWNELLGREDVATRAINGDIIPGYQARLGQVLRLHPKIVFIEGGANDIYFHKPIDSVVAGLGQMIDTLQHAGIRVILHTLPPFARSNGDADSYNRLLPQLNQAILRLAHARNLPYIDLYTLFSRNGYLDKAFAQTDGVHLTGAAYKIWADEVGKKLQEILKRKNPQG